MWRIQVVLREARIISRGRLQSEPRGAILESTAACIESAILLKNQVIVVSMLAHTVVLCP